MAPVVRALQDRPEFDAKVCVTAQHREMLDQVLGIFEVTPDYDLNVMRSAQDLYDLTSRVLNGMRDVLNDVGPDLVLVHGDTTTTMSTSLAAYYQRIAVGHVEAGLRTHNIYSPWPEEINRQVASRIARFHFAPTERARDSLRREGIPDEWITVTGNTVIDALSWVTSKFQRDEAFRERRRTVLDQQVGFETERELFILVTGHRRENFGQGLLNICTALKNLATKYPGIHIVYPVHLNPNVRKPVLSVLAREPTIHLIEPLDYAEFVFLMSRSHLILTDSGGIQEEAPTLGKPVLVMRETTERPEAVEAGTVRVVGTDIKAIVDEASRLIDIPTAYEEMSRTHNPYGDGKASGRIVDVLLSALQSRTEVAERG